MSKKTKTVHLDVEYVSLGELSNDVAALVDRFGEEAMLERHQSGAYDFYEVTWSVTYE